jgi:hypothetical protein
VAAQSAAEYVSMYMLARIPEATVSDMIETLLASTANYRSDWMVENPSGSCVFGSESNSLRS